ncbi:hypothetical protein [Parasphingorhabdus sp.]|uniref:hypothetical protein n=1 Tax=Parasphingorhabdus sp. TaxID=2709688 RepID=UPI003D286B0B
MNKKHLGIGAATLLVIGGSYALTYDPQPRTHNGLVRVPTGDAEIDFDNALEDSKNAFKLHEEARMEGDFAKAAYYEEAAQTALQIGRKASFELNREILEGE